MKPKFEIIFLDQAIDFMSKLDTKARNKIYCNLDKVKLGNDSKLFKKMTGDIWYLEHYTKRFSIEIIGSNFKIA